MSCRFFFCIFLFFVWVCSVLIFEFFVYQVLDFSANYFEVLGKQLQLQYLVVNVNRFRIASIKCLIKKTNISTALKALIYLYIELKKPCDFIVLVFQLLERNKRDT